MLVLFYKSIPTRLHMRHYFALSVCYGFYTINKPRLIGIVSAILLSIASPAVAGTVCAPNSTTNACAGQPCDRLGATEQDYGHADIIECLLPSLDAASNDCSGGNCMWRSMSTPPFVHVSFELAGGGGGGGGSDLLNGAG